MYTKNVTPKSFRLKYRMKEYSQKLIDIAKNSAKQRLHKTVVKVKQICENLKRRTTDEHFVLIDLTTEKQKKGKENYKKRTVLPKNLKN